MIIQILKYCIQKKNGKFQGIQQNIAIIIIENDIYYYIKKIYVPIYFQFCLILMNFEILKILEVDILVTFFT